MVQANIVKTRFVIEFYGEGEKSGGTYTFSRLKHTATNDQIYTFATAINSLQAKLAKNIFKIVETEISE